MNDEANKPALAVRLQQPVRPGREEYECEECEGSVGCGHCDGTGKVDKYGNPFSGNRIINCCFPDCGCDGARLCQAESGASGCSLSLNIERGTRF